MQASFDAEKLIAEAREQTGLQDLGGDDFREGLGVLIETYLGAGFDDSRLRRERRRLLQLLATRLRVAEAFRQHPEIRERPIRAPLYLTGFPRTGTSALFNLLGIDPASRPLLLWEGIFPDPMPGLEPGQEDPRLGALRAYYEKGKEKNPAFSKIHDVQADGPEECVMLLAHCFRDVQMGIEVLLEPYASWFQQQDLRGSYAYYADLLRLLDWQRPGQRWLLKSPAHLWALDVLAESFPDGALVLTHRSPAAIVASYCSMMAALLGAPCALEPEQLGPVVLEYLARKMESALAARDRADPKRFLDVAYAEFVDAPMAAAERIYGHFGLDLPGATADLMRAHVEAHPQNRHGAHDYSLAEYGLSDAAVHERLRDYIERFDLMAP